jgi:DNA-binding FadR family transcriptional regulator
MPTRKAPSIAADLGARIEAGEWMAGELLPDERSLALELGVARNTVRNAFAILEANGLIERHVGRGTVVQDKPDEQFAGILERFLDASPLDILNLRIFIEPHTAAAAARNASETELAEIVKAGARAAESLDLEAYEHWDNEFHRRIYSAAHNQFLTDFFAMLTIIRYQAPMMEIRKLAFTEERRLAYGREHSAIIEALSCWDGDAARTAIRAHLISRRQNYFGE